MVSRARKEWTEVFNFMSAVEVIEGYTAWSPFRRACERSCSGQNARNPKLYGSFGRGLA